MGSLLDIGISGLRAQQAALTITGNNITNAGTEGYSRQEVSFTENPSQFKGGVWVGSGVSVDSVRRVYALFSLVCINMCLCNGCMLILLDINI